MDGLVVDKEAETLEALKEACSETRSVGFTVRDRFTYVPGRQHDARTRQSLARSRKLVILMVWWLK